MLGPWTDLSKALDWYNQGQLPRRNELGGVYRFVSRKANPNLPPKSVVVIDNASYHSVQEDKCPTQASRKADMQALLTKHNVAWSNDMPKVELLELCRTHRPLPTYVVAETLKQHEHRDCDPVAPLFLIIRNSIQMSESGLC